jgi:hypothetical protein
MTPEDYGHRVVERECAELFALTREQWIDTDHEAAGAQLDQSRKDPIEVASGSGVQDRQLHLD